MHPGPINRGVEITSAVADSDHAIILDQVEKWRRNSNGHSLSSGVEQVKPDSSIFTAHLIHEVHN